MAISGRPVFTWATSLALLAATSATTLHAQMHYVKKPGTVVRAIGVYEWTGDLAKPNASRLIPISIFIEGKLEDAGVYLARPVPMALQTGTVFELDRAGVPTGLLDLSFARHLQPSEASDAAPYDDGWFGYGTFKKEAAPKPTLATNKVRQSKAVLQSSKPDTASPHLSNKTDSASNDNSRPTLTRRDGSAPNDSTSSTPAASTSNTSTAAPPDDPNRPTLQRRDGSTPAADTTPAPTQSTPTATTKTADKPDDDPDRPTLQRRDGSASASTSSTATPDSDRPTMKRRDDSSSTASTTSASAPADDPDRPTMKRRTDSSASSSDSTTASDTTPAKDDDPDRPVLTRRNGSDSTADSTSASAGTTPADDPDRPTLRKRTPAEKKQAQKENAEASVSGVGSLNDDPNRPTLHRGKPAHALTDDDLPKLLGLPVDLQQMAAVSDAVNRPEHDFTRPWTSSSEHEDVQSKMEDLARARLQAYLAPLTPATPSATAKKPAPNTPAARAAARKAKAAAANPPAPLPLTDEVLKSYTLSYGGAPTFCFSANSVAPDGTVRYVTVVTQQDANNDLKVAFANVTDSQHLDRTPRYRLVDVVDAEASNRASLLFELRAHDSRSFALYRVIGAQAEQIFSTGSTQ